MSRRSFSITRHDYFRDMPVTAIILLGAHRWARMSVLDRALESGLYPVVLIFEGEVLPESLRKRLSPSQVIYARRNMRVEDLRKQICDTLGDNWYALGLDDYVCELAAALPVNSQQKCFRPSAAIDSQYKHRLRKIWNSKCAESAFLYAVPYRYLSFTDFSFRQVLLKEESSDFDQDGPCIVKPDALDASIGVHSIENANSALENIREKISSELREVAEYAQTHNIKVLPTLIGKYLRRFPEKIFLC